MNTMETKSQFLWHDVSEQAFVNAQLAVVKKCKSKDSDILFTKLNQAQDLSKPLHEKQKQLW